MATAWANSVKDVRHLIAERGHDVQRVREHARPIVQRQREDGEVRDERAHRERHRWGRGDPAYPMTNVHERSVDAGVGDVEDGRLPLRECSLIYTDLW